MTTETLAELAEIVLKNNILSSMNKHFTAIGTLFDPPYAILFMNCTYAYGGGISMIFFYLGTWRRFLTTIY